MVWDWPTVNVSATPRSSSAKGARPYDCVDVHQVDIDIPCWDESFPLPTSQSCRVDDGRPVDSPGKYIICTEAGVLPSVALGHQRSKRDFLLSLPVGTRVDVLEVVPVLEQKRVRARIASPAGWISLMDLETGHRWARKCQEPAEMGPQQARARAGDQTMAPDTTPRLLPPIPASEAVSRTPSSDFLSCGVFDWFQCPSTSREEIIGNSLSISSGLAGLLSGRPSGGLSSGMNSARSMESRPRQDKSVLEAVISLQDGVKQLGEKMSSLDACCRRMEAEALRCHECSEGSFQGIAAEHAHWMRKVSKQLKAGEGGCPEQPRQGCDDVPGDDNLLALQRCVAAITSPACAAPESQTSGCRAGQAPQPSLALALPLLHPVEAPRPRVATPEPAARPWTPTASSPVSPYCGPQYAKLHASARELQRRGGREQRRGLAAEPITA